MQRGKVNSPLLLRAAAFCAFSLSNGSGGHSSSQAEFVPRELSRHVDNLRRQAHYVEPATSPAGGSVAQKQRPPTQVCCDLLRPWQLKKQEEYAAFSILSFRTEGNLILLVGKTHMSHNEAIYQVFSLSSSYAAQPINQSANLNW